MVMSMDMDMGMQMGMDMGMDMGTDIDMSKPRAKSPQQLFFRFYLFFLRVFGFPSQNIGFPKVFLVSRSKIVVFLRFSGFGANLPFYVREPREDSWTLLFREMVDSSSR